MKLKKARIVIRSVDDIKNEWKEAIKGRAKSSSRKDEIVLTSFDVLAKIFSKTRMEILKVIIVERPQSIYEVAKLVDRDFKNVHADVRLLADIGLLELKEAGDTRNGLIPIPKFSGIELDLAA